MEQDKKMLELDVTKANVLSHYKFVDYGIKKARRLLLSKWSTLKSGYRNYKDKNKIETPKVEAYKSGYLDGVKFSYEFLKNWLDHHPVSEPEHLIIVSDYNIEKRLYGKDIYSFFNKYKNYMCYDTTYMSSKRPIQGVKLAIKTKHLGKKFFNRPENQNKIFLILNKKYSQNILD